MKEVSVTELNEFRIAGTPHQLIDVREDYEVESVNIGGLWIPMGNIPMEIAQIRKDVPVIIHCKSGMRSANITKYLESQGFDNVSNLKGGIFAWIDQIEPSLPKY
jgi:sulfur-carrier protein adenylyltransferase/sulfurtransferase